MFHVSGRGSSNAWLWRTPVPDETLSEPFVCLEGVGQVSSWSVRPSLDIDKKNFNLVTRYLPDCAAVLEACAGRTAQIEQLCAYLELGNWAEILESYKGDLDSLPRDALGAFHEGKISMPQFCTITFFWSLAKSGKELVVAPLFIGDEVNFFVKSLIAETMKKSGKLVGLQPDFLDEAEISAFFTRMHAAPKSEQVLLLSKPEEGFVGPISTITQEIYQKAGTNVFNKCLILGSVFDMNVSFSMVQQFLKTYAGERAIEITPVIGLSSVEDIVRNLKTSTRDMAIPFPGVFIPDSADGFTAPNYRDFFLHDLYHAILCSEIPLEIRPTFSLLSDIILEVKESASDLRVVAFLDEFFHRIVDNEHPVFRKHNGIITGYVSPENQIKFMYAVLAQYQNAITRLEREPKEPISQEDLKEITSILQRIGVFERFFQILREKDFCTSFGISPCNIALMRFLPPKSLDLQKIILIHLWQDPENIKILATLLIKKHILEGLKITEDQKRELIDFLSKFPRPATIAEYDAILEQLVKKEGEMAMSSAGPGIQMLLDTWGDSEIMQRFLNGAIEALEMQGIALLESQRKALLDYLLRKPRPMDRDALSELVAESITHALAS
jgi:hypothetical protein